MGFDLKNSTISGFSSKEPAFPKTSFNVDSASTGFGLWWRIFVVIYLVFSLGILKLAYLYPVLEDLCSLYHEKKKYFTRSLTYYFFTHVEVLFLVVLSIFYNSGELGTFTMYGGDYFNYGIYVGVVLLIQKQRQEMSKCLSIRGIILTVLVMVNYCVFVLLDQSFLLVFVTLFLYILYYCIDTNNEKLLKLIFKVAGLINDDDAFDTEFLGQMRRRRFSSNFFTDTVDDIKYDKELVHSIKK